MARRPNSRPLGAVHPNHGIEVEYRKRLLREIAAMQRSLEYWLLSAYRSHPPVLAQDISAAEVLRRAVRRLTARWVKRFNDMAGELAKHFATANWRQSDAALKQVLAKGGISVNFTLTPAMREIMQATVADQVGLIRSIPQQHLQKIEGMVMRSVTTGRDIDALRKELQDAFGVTQRRAWFIAKDQNNKATATMTRARQVELGFTQAIWLHSGGGKHPRPEHVAFSGQTYDVTKGAFLEGQWTWPGYEINCRCVSKVIVPAT